MKNHFLSLFDPVHRWWTLSFFLAAVVLVAASAVVTISDNPPGIALLFAGMTVLILAFVHPWRKPVNYGILAAVCMGVIALIFLGLFIYSKLFLAPPSPPGQGGGEGFLEAVVMITILFVCLPGILLGILGAMFWSFRKK